MASRRRSGSRWLGSCRLMPPAPGTPSRPAWSMGLCRVSRSGGRWRSPAPGARSRRSGSSPCPRHGLDSPRRMTSFMTRNCVDWRGRSALERAIAQVTQSRDCRCCREDRSLAAGREGPHCLTKWWLVGVLGRVDRIYRHIPSGRGTAQIRVNLTDGRVREPLAHVRFAGTPARVAASEVGAPTAQFRARRSGAGHVRWCGL